MQTLINNAYTDEQRAQFAYEIFTALSPHPETHYMQWSRLKEATKRWDCFVPFAPRPMTASEGEVAYIESLYDQLRPYAFEWLTNYRLAALAEEIDSLRKSNGGRLGPPQVLPE